LLSPNGSIIAIGPHMPTQWSEPNKPMIKADKSKI